MHTTVSNTSDITESDLKWPIPLMLCMVAVQYLIGVKYCILDLAYLMFVRLLVMLISDVLCCFSVLVCCRTLVLIVVHKGWN